MNKTQMISTLALACSMPKSQAELAVNVLFDAKEGILAKALSKGDGIAIQGFGSFNVRKRAARKAVTPFGGTVRIPAHRVVLFRAGKTLKDRLNRKKR